MTSTDIWYAFQTIFPHLAAASFKYSTTKQKNSIKIYFGANTLHGDLRIATFTINGDRDWTLRKEA